MSTATLGACVGVAFLPMRGIVNVFDTDERDWFILQDKTGARVRRRRDQIDWRTTTNTPSITRLKEKNN